MTERRPTFRNRRGQRIVRNLPDLGIYSKSRVPQPVDLQKLLDEIRNLADSSNRTIDRKPRKRSGARH